jgi:peptidoglycan/LPS O-acetylase OafA/YrhL
VNQWQGLNILRGFGALMIVLHHANADVIPLLPKVPGAAGFMIATTRNFGWSGIDLFFVLGGFLMANAFLRDSQKNSSIDVVSYWKARIKRIVPSYYVLLIVLAITGATGYINFSDTRLAIQGIFIHFLFLNNYLDQLPNGPMWYLAAMVQLYVFIPLLLIFVSRIRKSDIGSILPSVSIVVILIAVAWRCLTVISGAHEPNDFMLTHFRIDSVLLGMLALYLLRTKHPVIDKIASHPYPSLALAALFLAPCIFLPRTDPYMFSIGFTLLALGYSLLIIVFVQQNFKFPTFLTVFLLALSTWSYNIYLWHYFIPRIIGYPYTWLQLQIQSAVNLISIQAIAQIFIFTVIAIIVGFIMTNLVEKPASKWIS